MTVIVLNATNEPLGVVPLGRAVVLVLAAKATVVQADGMLRSPSVEVPLPLVLRLVRYVRVPDRRPARPTRRTVLERDGHRCAYCDGRADTVDHVLPHARGGAHVWENVVAACRTCNGRKADRTLTELGWRLERMPSSRPVLPRVPRGVAA